MTGEPRKPGVSGPQIQRAQQASPAHLRDAAWVSTLLDQIQAGRFFGRITLHVEGGIVVRAVKEQSLLPPSAQK